MKNVKKVVYLTALVVLGSQWANAQEAILSTGGNSNGPGGSASHSVGQVNYTANSSISGDYNAEGVQHAYEVSEAAAGLNETGIDFDLSVYPNPTTGTLILTNSSGQEDLEYFITDGSGKRLARSVFSSVKTQINLDALSTGIYFLNVYQNGNKIKAFKIIKK